MSRVKLKSFFQSIHFKIPIVFGILFLMSFQIVGVYFTRQLEIQLISNFETQINNQSRVIANSAIIPLQETDDQMVREKSSILLQSATSHNVVNMQLVNLTGEIVAVANQVDQSNVGRLIEDTSVQSALVSGKVSWYQYVSPDNQNMLRVVTPVQTTDRTILGVLVVDASMASVYSQLQDISNIFINVMVVALISTILLAIILSSRGIVKPVSEIKEKTERIAEGIYDSGDVTVYGQDELGMLARSINDLAVKIKEANATTESERQRLDSVLTHMSDGVIATDRRGNIVIVNEAALSLLDINKREDILHESIMDVFKIRKKYTYRELLETKDELILSVVSDGVESIIKGEFAVIKRDSGFISGLVCVLSDITEQEKIDRERREFVSNVSHELRTPLTSMRSYTEALIEGEWKNEDIAPQFLDVIQSETDRMIRMVSDLLDLSKMDAGRQALQLELINLTKLFNRVLDRYNVLLSSEEYSTKQYVIVSEIIKEDVWVEVDQDRMIQVFDNVLNNAIKYSPDGGVITCRLIISGDRTVISISDQGLGIPKKSLDNIFKRFYRVDKARSRQQGGTGLGLAISREVVELHGGKIWVTSVEGEGSTFFVALPRVEFQDEEEWDE